MYLIPLVFVIFKLKFKLFIVHFRDLSSAKSTKIAIADLAHGWPLNVTLTRAYLDTCVEPFCAQLLDCLRKLLSNLNLHIDQIADVFLAGGCVYIPRVRLGQLFNHSLTRLFIQLLSSLRTSAVLWPQEEIVI